MAEKLDGDEFAQYYYKSEKGNIYTYLNLIDIADLKAKLEKSEPNVNVEWSVDRNNNGQVTKLVRVFNVNKDKSIIFVKTPEEAKAQAEKQSGQQKRITVQYDYTDIVLVDFPHQDELFQKGYVIVDQVATPIIHQVINPETGNMEARILVGKRKLRPNPFTGANQSQGSEEKSS